MEPTEIELGDVAKDTTTGYEGRVIARTEWENGCIRFTLQASGLNTDGKPIDSWTNDNVYMELMSKGNRASYGPAGGDRPSIVRSADPVA